MAFFPAQETPPTRLEGRGRVEKMFALWGPGLGVHWLWIQTLLSVCRAALGKFASSSSPEKPADDPVICLCKLTTPDSVA